MDQPPLSNASRVRSWILEDVTRLFSSLDVFDALPDIPITNIGSILRRIKGIKAIGKRSHGVHVYAVTDPSEVRSMVSYKMQKLPPMEELVMDIMERELLRRPTAMTEELEEHETNSNSHPRLTAIERTRVLLWLVEERIFEIKDETEIKHLPMAEYAAIVKERKCTYKKGWSTARAVQVLRDLGIENMNDSALYGMRESLWGKFDRPTPVKRSEKLRSENDERFQKFEERFEKTEAVNREMMDALRLIKEKLFSNNHHEDDKREVM